MNYSTDFPSIKDQVSPQEWQARVDLAACYRLVDAYEMTDLIYNHITARIPGSDDHLLINLYGLLYKEITASSLVKIDVEGNIVSKPDTDYGINKSGYVIHGAIHKARPEVKCVLHTHTRAGMAVAAMKCGLLPLSQTSIRFVGHIGYHDYEGPAVDLEERERIVNDLGPHDALIMRNHGLLTCGETVQQAFNTMYQLEMSCRSQVDSMAARTELTMPGENVLAHTAHLYQPGTRRPYGVLEWPAMLRLLDAQQKTSGYPPYWHYGPVILRRPRESAGLEGRRRKRVRTTGPSPFEARFCAHLRATDQRKRVSRCRKNSVHHKSLQGTHARRRRVARHDRAAGALRRHRAHRQDHGARLHLHRRPACAVLDRDHRPHRADRARHRRRAAGAGAKLRRSVDLADPRQRRDRHHLPGRELGCRARRAVNACKFPPVGKRSVGAGYPNFDFRPVPLTQAVPALNDSTLVVCMIETVEGLANVEAIAAVDGVDVLHVGCNDLLTAMGMPGKFGCPEIVAAIERVIAAAKKHGKFAGLGGERDMERQLASSRAACAS